jgi:ferredoxin
MAKIDPTLAADLKKYGSIDFNACYNCGNCTAVCGLTDENANFPRMFIRFGLLGLKDELLKSDEIWLCYACGDCTATCPREAFPGDYMASLRRYAIAEYEPSGITKLMFKSNPWFIAISLAIAAILGFFLLTIKPDMVISRWIFDLMPYEVIHNLGIGIFALTGLSMLIGFFRMLAKMKIKDIGKKSFSQLWQALKYVINELATMKRYQTCDDEENGFWKQKKSVVRPWFVHWSIMWGFIGLLVTTALDFILKDPSTMVWWPSRILGTLTGLLMIYGASLALYYRYTKITESYSHSKLADWVFIWVVWLAGFTGFWMEFAVMFEINTFLHQIIFIVHTIISMELILLFAFSKFAHALYRPVALFVHQLKTA